MRNARVENDLVVVSLFVNPLQFGPTEDLDAYPRDLDGDAAVAEAEGVDVLFAPSVDEMYPQPPRTTVHVDGLTAGLCGTAAAHPLRRRHHGGRQAVLDRRAVPRRTSAARTRSSSRWCGAWSPTSTCRSTSSGCPLVREPDGLAMSSRNAYLDADERRAASVLSRSLQEAATGDRRRRARRRRLAPAASPG